MAKEVVLSLAVRPLPGQLDAVPVFNSNSPEVVLTEGILLSTFPPAGMRSPSSHLNFPFQGRFDIFAHHIAKGEGEGTVYLGIILSNPGIESVTVDITSSKLSQSTRCALYRVTAIAGKSFGYPVLGTGRARDERHPAGKATTGIYC